MKSMPNVRNIVSVTFALESLRTNRETEEWREKDRIVSMWMTQFSAERTESDNLELVQLHKQPQKQI